MRYIRFNFADASSPSVYMREQPDGTITVELSQTGRNPGDIRGLFFDVRDPGLLPYLSITGSQVSQSAIGNERILSVGNGNNMNGAAPSPYDVGIAFSAPGRGNGVVTNTSFTLSSSVGGLTLDDLALVDFGLRIAGGGNGGKLTKVAPAAPDAINDTLSAQEDVATVFSVLANDTDEDGTSGFKIVSVSDPAHGTATISADGKSIIYVSDPNYSGPDSFTYDMIDGAGGGDSASATIDVVAVADKPTIVLSAAAGANVNQLILSVSAAVTDTDGSEFLDRFEFSGLPVGATIVGEPDLVFDPAGNGPILNQAFVLQLAPDTDFNFSLVVNAVAKESSNNDEEGATATQAVRIDANTNNFALSFQASDQSIWSTGDVFVLEDQRFVGLDIDPAPVTAGGFVYGELDFKFKAGFQSDLSFNGGEIDATVAYDVSITTTYNHVSDVLLIRSIADLDPVNTSFQTVGPEGAYKLDFIFEYLISAALKLDLPIVDDPTLLGITIGDNKSTNIIDVDSTDIGATFEFPFGLSASLAWPHISTSSGPSATSPFASEGASNNFLTLGLDVDQALADIFLGGANPFDINVDVGIGEGTIELLDFDISAGANFIQKFLMSVQGLDGLLIFENGASQSWNMVSDIVLTNASSYDIDNDGIVEFSLQLTPDATLNNNTDLGFNFGYKLDLLKGSGSYDVLGFDGDFSFGPVFSVSDNIPIGSVDVYNETFALQFASRTVSFNGNEALIV